MAEPKKETHTTPQPIPGAPMEALDENVSVQKQSSEIKDEALTPQELRDIGASLQDSVPKKPQVQNSPSSEKAKQPASTIQRIRTYKEDLSRALAGQKESVPSIVAAEERRRTRIPRDAQGAHTQRAPFDIKKILLISLSVLLVLFGGGVLGYFFFFFEKQEVIVEEDVPALIFTESQSGIDISGKSNREVLQALRTARATNSGVLGEITHLFFTKTDIIDGVPTNRLITSSEFFQAVGAQVGGPFLRSLQPEFTIGIHVFNQNQPFIILKTSSYQNNFAGMLDWEDTLYSDLFLFMGRNTNPRTGESIVLKENFEDRIVQNVDIRALETTSGDIELLYAYPNQQTLIITTNTNTLIEIITRLNSVGVF